MRWFYDRNDCSFGFLFSDTLRDQFLELRNGRHLRVYKTKDYTTLALKSRPIFQICPTTITVVVSLSEAPFSGLVSLQRERRLGSRRPRHDFWTSKSLEVSQPCNPCAFRKNAKSITNVRLVFSMFFRISWSFFSQLIEGKQRCTCIFSAHRAECGVSRETKWLLRTQTS